jgi:hypothetical protein
MIPPIGGDSVIPFTASPSSADRFGVQLSQAANSNEPGPSHQYDDADVFAAGGPRPDDAVQGQIADCYFMVALASFAQQQPALLRNAITFDANTGNFNVTLYKDHEPWNPLNNEQKTIVQVTQQEIQSTMKRRGDDQVNNGAQRPLWPVIMETARAKMLDGNPADGLNEGYNALESQGPFGAAGGFPSDAMETISGRPGNTEFSTPLGNMGDVVGEYSPLPEIIGGPAWAAPPFAADDQYNQVKAALADGRAVALMTPPWNVEDGLASRHAYQVEDVQKDVNGNVQVTLRNPWGNNNIGEDGVAPNDPRLTIRMGAMGASMFTIGPSPQETGVG